jgi:hypothetical protein
VCSIDVLVRYDYGGVKRSLIVLGVFVQGAIVQGVGSG